MKILILSFLILRASLCAVDAHGALALKPTECPFGHSELKQVPIQYGMLAWDADLQKRIDNLEVWQGGCILGDEKEKTVCTKCRYYFEPHFGYWSKLANAPRLLQLKPDPFIADWPVGKKETNGGQFYQHVRGRDVCGEEFYCGISYRKGKRRSLYENISDDLSLSSSEKTGILLAGTTFIIVHSKNHSTISWRS